MNSLKSGSSLIVVPTMVDVDKPRDDRDAVRGALAVGPTPWIWVVKRPALSNDPYASHDYRIPEDATRPEWHGVRSRRRRWPGGAPGERWPGGAHPATVGHRRAAARRRARQYEGPATRGLGRVGRRRRTACRRRAASVRLADVRRSRLGAAGHQSWRIRRRCRRHERADPAVRPVPVARRPSACVAARREAGARCRPDVPRHGSPSGTDPQNSRGDVSAVVRSGDEARDAPEDSPACRRRDWRCVVPRS